MKEEDLVVSPEVLESLSLRELVEVEAELALVLEVLDVDLTTPPGPPPPLFLSLSLSLKNLNLSNIEFLLLVGGLAADVVLFEEDVEEVDPALVRLDCFSERFWLRDVGIPDPRPPGVGIPEDWAEAAGGEVGRLAEPALPPLVGIKEPPGGGKENVVNICIGRSGIIT